MADKTYGVAWCDGRDPEDGGWHFDDGGTVDGHDMAYEAGDRAAALKLGVPEEVLDMFEAGGGKYGVPCESLFDWLSSGNGVKLFRT